MASAQRFEDLIAWQKARALTKAIYQATRRDSFARDFGLSGQIQRASVSIMSNIAEGFERGNPGDYQRFLAIAKASCGEVRSQLYVAFDIGYLSQSEWQEILAQAHEISKIIGGLIASVSRKRQGNT
ncbi:MAG: four helix bundle protein [Chloroflexota bacterium]